MRTSRTTVFVFVLTLIVLNASLYAGAYSAFDNWLGNRDHRLPNVRLLSEQCRAPAVRRFISMQDWSLPSMIVLGDSQPFNSGFPLESTWPFLINQKAGMGLRVVNLAVIDGRPEDTAFIARQLPAGSARLAFVNLNQSHFVGDHLRYVSPIEPAPLEFEKCAFEMRRLLLAEKLPLPDTVRGRETFRKTKLSPDRYRIDINRDTITTMISAVAEASAVTTAFVTPNNVDAFDLYGYDVDRFQEKSEEMEAACASSGLARCINLSMALSMNNFYDIVHLNTSGNRALADLLATKIPVGQ
ncbi:hypothetical protein [Rhizobium sp. S96]|uniref:hypothetical protein n=1 Tax=Rhizobium sp. S96 TaxID=3055140 RepID=UPI0025AAFEEF|nr:hypothetical protein [Rhizobium sp. S96]MDM9619066.1 hypothetical protein [Rhizobium sp. S96]